MEVAGTISSYLESEEKYDHLFWTSYSMDPITIEFLFKNDLTYCLNKPYFHFICDKNKLDETVEASLGEPKKVNRLSQMQSYLLLSNERMEGAFHPKILFFSGKNILKCIILSGNATSSGILSNQDLVARFEWSSSGTNEFQNELASVFQFLRSFDGWNKESQAELDSVARSHLWLTEARSENVFYSDGVTPILNQFVSTLPIDWDVEKILIFSPFADPQLRALTEIAKAFSSSTVTMFYPGDIVEVNNPDIELPNNLTIQSSGELGKSRFHAKYFVFLGKGNAYALWGSANCSYSALISPTRNKEILIGYELEPSELYELWPGLNDKTHTPVRLVKLNEKESTKQPNEIELLSGRLEEGSIELVANKDFSSKDLRLLLSNGEELQAYRVSTSNCRLKVSAEDTHKICAAYICDRSGNKISNALYLNNFLKIQKSVDGAQNDPSYDQLKEDQKKLVSRLGSEFFLLDRKKPKSGGKGQNSSASDAFAFWHMPSYSKRQAAMGIFGHERFISYYVTERKNKRDLDGDENGDPNGETSDQRQSKKERSAILALRKQAKKIHEVLITLDKNKSLESKVPFDRWLRGEDYMLRFFLEAVQEYEFLEERDLNEIKCFLNDFLHIVFYTLTKLQISEHEDGEGFIKSVNMMCSLYLLLTKYSWCKMSIEKGTLSTIGDFDKNTEDLADAAFMKILAERCLDQHELDRTYEAKDLLLEDVSKCLHHGPAAYEALAFVRPGLRHVDEPDIEVNDIVVLKEDVFIFKGKKDGDFLEFTPLLGKSKFFSAEYIQPRKICGFKDLINT